MLMLSKQHINCFCLSVLCSHDNAFSAGKTSLKRTLFGEPYDSSEKPTSGITADPSVTRITFKQYREWIQQPTSKADTHRLNLDYIDIIIDYTLNFLKQPHVSSSTCLTNNKTW